MIHLINSLIYIITENSEKLQLQFTRAQGNVFKTACFVRPAVKNLLKIHLFIYFNTFLLGFQQSQHVQIIALVIYAAYMIY